MLYDEERVKKEISKLMKVENINEIVRRASHNPNNETYLITTNSGKKFSLSQESVDDYIESGDKSRRGQILRIIKRNF